MKSAAKTSQVVNVRYSPGNPTRVEWASVWGSSRMFGIVFADFGVVFVVIERLTFTA